MLSTFATLYKRNHFSIARTFRTMTLIRSILSSGRSRIWSHTCAMTASFALSTGGVSSSLFAPEDGCTRAQIVTFLYRAAKATASVGASAFADVADSAYYADAVKWATEQGITKDISSTLFGPDETCTRAQIVTFLYRLYGSK